MWATPNDLLLTGQKICGILIEQQRRTIVGIGLNLNQTDEEFAAVNLPVASSLRAETGNIIDPDTALATVVLQLDAQYDRLLRMDFEALEADWNALLGLIGQAVMASYWDGTMSIGQLQMLTFERVEIEEADGTIRSCVPEQVRHLSRV